MKTVLTAIRDLKANKYIMPQLFGSIADANRAYAAALGQENSAFSMFPEDFELVQIGFLDLESLVWESLNETLIDGGQGKQIADIHYRRRLSAAN